MGSSWISLSRFLENSIKPKYKIKQSDNLRKLGVFLTTISHTCGTIKPPWRAAITIIRSDNGKCLDYHICSTKYKSCQQWKGKEDSLEYNEFMIGHWQICSINHQGFEGSMEASWRFRSIHDWYEIMIN